MPGELLDVTGDGREDAVLRATETLRDGRLVVLPTDTAYGVAADAFNRAGTTRLFRAKGQPRTTPLPVLVRSPKQLAGLTTIVPEAAERLVAAYWPGPLTVVLFAEPNLRWDLGNAQGTVAVRMPLDDVGLAVVRAVGPLAVTAAARTGEPAPATAAAAHEQLGDAVELYLDDGPRPTGAASTIVDLTREEPQVLRAGALDADEVLAVARGELDPFAATMPPPEPDSPADDAGTG
ncbi:L-threonylcarbamoyladenylate synthase [Egicoccus sp. AB-alg2]|uniref:L-threonylcarbamoyladenylate synthase n=1 Tax=Egicoccus sp. AB-alg2 TaxID=3242693 RepID=UPI00359CBD56